MSILPMGSFRGLISLAALLGLVGVLTVVPRASAQAPKGDLLDQIKKKTEVEAQRVENEVREALAEAQRLAGSDPARAADRLRRTLATLEADRSLTAARRDLLIRQVRDRIRVADAEAEKLNKNTGKAAALDAKTRDAEQRAVQAEYINRMLEHIHQLQQQGRTTEATRAAEDLFRRYPNLAAPQAIGKTTTILDQVANLRAIQGEAATKRIAALTSIDRSAMAPGSEVDFPKNWAEIVKKRDVLTQAHISPKDREILKSLGQSMNVDYDKIGFLEVIEDISTKLGQPILLDKNSLSEAGVSSETQVSLKIKGVTGRTVLRKILGDLGLAYIIKDQAIQVVTERIARETMVTRTYYLGNLLAGGPFSDAGIRFVPGLTQFEALQNVLSIINLIQSSVDPASWSANGGQGTITFHAPTMSLTIRNTAEVHGMLGGYLR